MQERLQEFIPHSAGHVGEYISAACLRMLRRDSDKVVRQNFVVTM